MSDERTGDEQRDTIAALLRMPVGRRWLLKTGLTLAAAEVFLQSTPALAGRPDGKPQPLEDGVLHFSLGPVAHLKHLRVIAHGQECPLRPHTRGTRRALRARGTLWRKLDAGALTHYAYVPRPQGRALLTSVHGLRRGREVVLAQHVHVPAQATRALARLAFHLEGHYGSVAGAPARLAALGLDAAQLASAQEVVDLASVVDTHTTAITLAMCHPNVATIDSTAAAATQSLLGQTPEVSTLGSYIGQMQQSGQDFAALAPAVDATGQPSQIQVGTQTTGFSTFQLNKTDPTFTATARSAFVAGIQGVRDTGSLGTVLSQPLDASPPDTSTWHQPAGLVVTPTAVTASATLGGSPPPLGAALEPQIQNTGLLFGTYTALNGSLSGRQLPLKLYNNYVRWVWVYVQYLAVDGTNLSLNDTPTWPDTRYAQSLGLLPQIFTVLGIPLWDTNTIEVTLDFPPRAASARLLFCGLGNDAVGGGWRQYFPAEAYPDHIAPQDEVLFAALMTGLLSLGLTSFALLTDLDIATTWAALKEMLFEDSGFEEDEFYDALDALLKEFPALTAAESFATLVAAGGATYEDIEANGGSTANIWSILVALGSVIPKIIFNPSAVSLWEKIAATILADETADKLIEAIPLIGEVIAVIEAVGDAATLAEAVGETAASPWVIANRISLTYPVTVTVSPDTSVNTLWPETARAWRLEAKIDGAVVLTPFTGALAAGQSADVVVTTTAPFVGKTIAWSFVALDAAGNQVGTGVSAQLANNDANNPPSSVAFAIAELPEPITAATVFQRSYTTAYSAASGYLWSPGLSDTGTLVTSGVQEITGVTVATRLYVAGLVWKQNDRYWLRGIPLVETSAPLALGGATRQGYARRPFLLFDAFVGPDDVANHVLLEPDDTEPGYHIRSLAIDPATGALSWDPTTSLGDFTLPVSAAALHSSGRVVAVHTDSGRLGQVRPAATPLPTLAAYTAGPGTQIGLLSSPTAVAVTHPGTVIVLEAGASQLAAFDLNGNPVPYFGGTAPGAFTLPLPTSATYLDVAVDGSSQIYLLSYSNDGSQPGDYRIDVYTPTGAPLATNSPGTNIPHLAVDYWRSLFAANYTPLLDQSTGQPRIDPTLGVAEPSLSRFDPS